MDFESLIDRDLLALAAERHTAAEARLVQAQGGLAAAADTYSVACAASSDAVAGIGTLSAIDAEVRLEQATRTFSVGQKVVGAAEQSLKAAEQTRLIAEGRAWVPVALAAIRARIAAARAADTARAAVAAAEADFVAAGAAITLAEQHGTNLPLYSAPLRATATEAEEIGFWNEKGMDVAAGDWPWLRQFKPGVL